MVREYYERICAGEQVRANLIQLKEQIKDEKERRAFAYLLGGDFKILCSLLNNEDPKIRRNAALILGQMESEDLLPILFDTYQKEETRFIRADYLRAISEMDYRPVLDRLEEKLESLRLVRPKPEEEKHVSEEIRILQSMVLKYRKKARHKFTGYHEKPEMILVTNRCQREATARQIPGGRISMLAGGIRVKHVEVEEILPLRTWSELLFPLETEPLDIQNPSGLGTILAGSVLEKARMLHQKGGAFLFRIELKSRMEASKKGSYIHRISDAVERSSGGWLINSVADYELEIRLLERKDGTFVPMLKLFTISQKRFAYRKDVVASSIAPVNAALTAELARPCLKKGAQILDPFCGVGTMLIERAKAVEAGTMYGIDIFGEAIDKARLNTGLSGCRVNYINKDFFEFEHEYLFDEIITDMPQATSAKSRQEIKELYHRFFGKAMEVLKEDSVMILYATEPRFVDDCLEQYKTFRLEERFIINEKNGTTVFVIRRA